MAMTPVRSTTAKRTTPTASASSIRRGQKGPAVKSLQENLIKHGEGSKVGRADGDFGPKTAAGLQSFQDKKLTSLNAQINASTSDSQAISLSQQRNTLQQERNEGVAGQATQRLLAQAPTTASSGQPSTDSFTASGAPTNGTAPVATTPAPTPGPLTSGLQNQPNPAQIDAQSGVSYDETLRTENRPQLQNGASGPDVEDLQTTLNAQGFDSGTVDGKFGPKTEAAVRAFQTDKGLASDGIVGPKTWTALAQGDLAARAPTNDAPVNPNPNAPADAAPTTTDATPRAPSALEASRTRTDSLEADLRQAQEHEREPDLSTAKSNLADHLESDYIPKLEARQQSLGQQLFRATEHGQPTDALRADYDANATELTRSRALLDEAQGAPITRADAGVLDPGAGFDLQNPPGQFDAKVTAPNGASYSVSVSASDAVSAGPNGEETRTLEISRSQSVGAGGGGDVGAVGLSGGVFAGESMSYSVTVPEAHYQRVLAGQAAFPDPGNISTMPPGSSALIRAEDFVGGNAKGSYGAFSIGAGSSESSGTSIGLEVGEDSVRVLAGPTEAVTQSAQLGLGGKIGPEQFQIGAEVNLGGSTSLRNSELAFADLSRDSGQAAYADFLRSGDVPGAGEIGVGTAGTISQVDVNSSSSVGGSVEFGPLELSGTLLDGRSVSGTRTDVNYNDGSRETSVAVAEGGVTTFANATYNAQGRETASQTGLILDGVDSSYTASLGEALGVSPGARGDFQVEMSDADFGTLRERTIAGIEQREGKEFADALRAGPNSSGSYETASGAQFDPFFDPVTSAVIQSDSASEFLQHPALRGRGPTTVADGLLKLYLDDISAGPIPGTHSAY